MNKATLTNENGLIVIRTPYNASLVQEIKSLPGRRWNADERAWTVPASQEMQAREIVRRYFQIEGKESALEYEIVRCHIFAKVSAKRTYNGNVAIDGHEIVNMYGSVRRNDDAFEVIEEQGGFLRGDSRHAFEVEYTLTLKVRKGAAFERTGHADYWGRFEILGNESPTPDGPDTSKKEGESSPSIALVKKSRTSSALPPALAVLQLPEGAKARFVRGKIVISRPKDQARKAA